MSDPDSVQAPGKPIPVRATEGASGQTPVPAERAGKRGKQRGRRDGRRKHGGDRGARKPTPVREAVGATSGGTTLEPDLEEVSFSVDGVDWTARVRGRTGGARSTPLLLLGFQRTESKDEGPERESLVVGRTLEGLSATALAEALEKAWDPVDPREKRPFFEEVGDGRRR